MSEKWATQEATVELADGTKVVDEERLAGLLNTVYPCKVHNPSQFFRWAGGHMKPEHDKAACRDCRDTGAAGRGHHRSRGVQPPPVEPLQPSLPQLPERRDLD